MPKEEKPAAIFVRYTGISGEDEFVCSTIVPFPDEGKSVEEAIQEYFSDFFGKGTEKDGEFYYLSPDGCLAAKISGWTTVPESDAAVLRKYM